MRVQYVNIYELEQHYGGPEEGGWWFDSGRCVRSFPCRPAQVETMVRRMRAVLERSDDGKHRSMSNGTPDYIARVETHTGRDFPDERPFYE
jgi:hypothetical protein